MKLDGKQIAILHAYPKLAGLSEPDRRDVMRRHSGCASASEDLWEQHTFENAMAAFETILWTRVATGVCKDPRLCRQCGRRLVRLQHGYGECPEGCEKRKVYSWDMNYWRSKVTMPGVANSRLVHKVRELWAMLCDYLPADERTDRYLHGIIEQATNRASPLLILGGQIQWDRLSPEEANFAIEALKDRLRNAVKDGHEKAQKTQKVRP